ncbi:MAG: hypothetical protein PHQ45_02475 [Acidaminococcaceae bacterium]|nr:hypothetical protein [Acidaminococcaceae bacterium]
MQEFYEKFKTPIIIVALLLLSFGGGYLLGLRAAGQDGASTAAGLDRAAAVNTDAKALAGAIEKGVNVAGEHVDRAASAAAGARETAARATDGARRSQAGLKHCQELCDQAASETRRAEQLINELIKGAKETGSAAAPK